MKSAADLLLFIVVEMGGGGDLFFYFLMLIIFSISMYIMCVCLFSALSRRVDALQIIIIIIIVAVVVVSRGRVKITRSLSCAEAGIVGQ